MDTVSGEAIGTETLRYGQRATVVALPAPPIRLTPRGLEGRWTWRTSRSRTCGPPPHPRPHRRRDRPGRRRPKLIAGLEEPVNLP